MKKIFYFIQKDNEIIIAKMIINDNKKLEKLKLKCKAKSLTKATKLLRLMECI